MKRIDAVADCIADKLEVDAEDVVAERGRISLRLQDAEALPTKAYGATLNHASYEQ